MKDICGTSAEIASGTPHQIGAHFDGAGTNFALFSENAQSVDLCLFSSDGRDEIARLALPERTGSVWHGYVPGLKPGALYGYRVHGAYTPEHGHRFNANKLLLDPYTRAFFGGFTEDPAIFGYDQASDQQDLSFSTIDSAAFVPKSVVSHPDDFAYDAATLGKSWDGTFVYEAHVKGATQLHPDIPQALRGTYDGLASQPMLEHLNRLGITAVELLPVQSLKSESALHARGLSNYWGYNTIGFFAPEPRYFGPSGVLGFRAMVDKFHNAGIEVILDVVYNHTAESNHLGPTLSFRGIDNASYYRLVENQPRYYENDTGCGNALNIGHPQVLRMVMDSLRFWVQAMGVDGFRFDLATTLAREPQGFDASGRFLSALRQDPVLAGVKLIAEPWDVGLGGYQLGNFPPEFAEWNDRFRDTVRTFWRGDKHSAQGLGSALLGSADLFDRSGRRSWSTVNFTSSHDGFTLADTTRYVQRHNHANGENNNDGHGENLSDNFGVEGDSDDGFVIASRSRRMRNMLATVLLSQGTPMLLAGDEGGNSQMGNNNAYCQDNSTTWIDWQALDGDQIAFTAALSAFRSRHDVLRQSRFMHGVQRDDGVRDVEWLAFDGAVLNWDDQDLSSLCLLLRGNAECQVGKASSDMVLLAFNRAPEARMLVLPPAKGKTWQCEIDTTTAVQSIRQVDTDQVAVGANSVAAYALVEDL